jgi:uncharacterized protein YggE
MLKTLKCIFCFGLFLTTGLLYLSVAQAAVDNNTIDVAGQCEKKVMPDRGQITFTIIELQKEPSLAAQKLTARTEKLIESLKKLSLKESTVSTTGINLNERKDYENNKYISKGFEARTSISLQTSEIEKLGKAFSVASSQNVDNVESFSTFLSTAKYNSEYNDCLEDAVKNARMKAERLAKAAGANVGPVEQISESGAHSPPSPIPYSSKVQLQSVGAEMADMPVAIGNQDFKVTVAVRFRVK